MAGPGGHEVERIAVKVVPDTDGFKEELLAKLEAIERGAKVEVDIELKGEESAKATLDALAKNLTATIKVELENLAEVRGQLANLARQRTLHLDVDIDTTFAKAKLAEISRNKGLSIQVDLDLQKARIELAVFLRPRRLTVHVDVDRDAFRQLRLHLAQMSILSQGIARRFQDMGQVAQSAFGQATRSASSFGSIIRPIYLVALPFLVAAIYLLIGAIAGLVIVIGAAVGGLLLMVPPIAAIAAGIAYVLKSSDKQAKKLRKNFEGIKTTAQGVLRSAIKPMTGALQAQVPFVQRWVASLKGPLRQAFKGASQYVDDLTLGLTNFVNNALDGTVKALKSPGLSAAFAGFQQFIADIGTAIGLFFLTLSEGGANYRDMFNALGTALIELTPPLARMLNAFAGVSPGIIDSLADNLTEIFTILSDPQVLGALASLASFSFDAVVWGLRLIAWQIIYTVGLWQGMWATAQWIWNALRSLISSVWAHIKNTTLTAVETIRSTVSSKWNGMISFLRGLLNGFTGWFGGFWNRITGQSSRGALSTRAAAVGPFSGMASTIAGIMSSIVSIVESAWNRISGIVSQIAGAIGRARNLVSGLSGLADKVNPFNLFTAPTVDTNTPTVSLLSTDTEPTFTTLSGLNSIQDSVDDMAHVDRQLRRKYQRNRSNEIAGAPAGRDDKSLAPRVFNFTTYAAPNVPTEKQFVKWLDYADTLYAI